MSCRRHSNQVYMNNSHSTLMRIKANHLIELTSQSPRLTVGKLMSLKTAKLLENLPRATHSLTVQLRTGHFPITKSYRYRFRLTDNPKCNTCRLDDTISHRKLQMGTVFIFLSLQLYFIFHSFIHSFNRPRHYFTIISSHMSRNNFLFLFFILSTRASKYKKPRKFSSHFFP